MTKIELLCFLSEGLIERLNPTFEDIASLLRVERKRDFPRIGDITVLFTENGINSKRFTLCPINGLILVTYSIEKESGHPWLAIKNQSGDRKPVDHYLEIGSGDMGYVSNDFFVNEELALEALGCFLKTTEIDRQLNWKNLELGFEYI